MLKSWVNISKNPVAPQVHDFLLAELKTKRAGRSFNFIEFLQEFTKGCKVLDIGVVEHDSSHIDAVNWKHRIISESALEVLGIDILEHEVEILQKRGFNVMVADATSNIDLGLRFERIIIADVIEHVENDKELVRELKRVTKMRIILTTPTRKVNDPGHLRVYTKEMLESLGMTVHECGWFWFSLWNRGKDT